MILTCPECSTKYLSKPETIGPNGRTVRCAKCETTWFVSHEDAETHIAEERALEEDLHENINSDLGGEPSQHKEDEVAEKGAHVLMRDKADAEKLRRRRHTILGIWMVPLTILGVAAILGYVFRQVIVNRVPGTATLYQSFGVNVKSAGLEIESPTTRTAIIDGQTVLVVNSVIENISPESQPVPLVQLTLHNGSGEELAAWYVEPNETRLSPKARLEFATQYPDPPVDAVKLRYSFASD